MIFLRAALARLIWYALNPATGSATMPPGWVHGRLGAIAAITDAQPLPSDSDEVAMVLAKLFEGETEGFIAWIGERTKSLTRAYDVAIRDADLETVSGFMNSPTAKGRLPLLEEHCGSLGKTEGIQGANDSSLLRFA